MARFGRSRARAVVPLADAVAQSGRRDTQAGILARALAKADSLGLVVPETWVVVADAFRQVAHGLPPAHDPGALLRVIHRPAGVERAARARERMLAAVIDDDVERELDAAFEALSELAPWGVAVRASAVLPDRGVSRAAALSSTELAVFDREELGRAIRRIWALAVSETTLSYLRARRFRDVAIAVVLQPVVAARLTVTLLTDTRAVPDLGPNRTEGSPERLAVVCSGLGSRYSDASTAEFVQFDVSGNVKKRRAPYERTKWVVRERSLAQISAESNGELLDEPRIAELAEVARRIDTLGATEVRCVIPEDGDLAVVDVARCHHVGQPAGGTAQTLWARDSAGDVPAEPMTVLSRDLHALSAVESVRRAFAPNRPKANRAASLLSTVSGRSYANLSPFLGLDGPKSIVDATGRIELLGAQWNRELEPVSVARPSLARAGLRLAQVATEQRLLSDDVNRFERESEQQRRWLSEMDLAILPDDALSTTLQEVREFFSRASDLFGQTHATAVNSHALLASVLSTADPSRSSWLAHAVSAGADVVTAKPATAFCHVAAITRLDTAASERLFASPPIRTPSDLAEGPSRRALGQFLAAYGNRGLTEAELGSPRFGEDPRPLFAMLRALLRGDFGDPDVALSRARSLADRQLAELEPNLSFFETRLVRDVTSRHREVLRLRERCRQHVARGLAMMRTVAVDVDRRLRRAEPVLEADSALHLTLDELGLAVAKSQVDLAPIVRARRADLGMARGGPEPPAVFRGIPFPLYPASRDEVFRGLSGSSGTAEGPVVRVGERLEGIEAFSPGAVLVVKNLDIGLAGLFFAASAVVAELGTPLSSSVVVARDCAIPVVTGVDGAWVRLRDGQVVRVNGDDGTVAEVAR